MTEEPDKKIGVMFVTKDEADAISLMLQTNKLGRSLDERLVALCEEGVFNRIDRSIQELKKRG